MSETTQTVPAPDADSGDELINIPTGQSRLRYIATIGLVLFLLVIFVVSDLFMSTMTGGSGRVDEEFVTWEDPVSGESCSAMRSEFDQTLQFLSMLAGQGMYYPPSAAFRDLENEPAPRRAGNVTDEDAASFLVWEKLAKDAGVAVSELEMSSSLKSFFQTNDNLRAFASRASMTPLALKEGIRRISRVGKLQSLVLLTQRVPDSATGVKLWQEQFPIFGFQLVSVPTTDFVTQAKDEIPGDEELEAWFGEQPSYVQTSGTYMVPGRVVYEAAYVDLTSLDSFDKSALIAAYPASEGTDVEQLTRSYYDVNQSKRFMQPAEEAAEDPADDPADDADAAAAEPQKQVPFEFEAVKDRAQNEADIYRAMGALLTDLQDAMAADEEIDLIARATELGLATDRGADEGVESGDIVSIPGWGSALISGQLAGAPEGRLVPFVVISEDAMTIVRAIKKINPVRKPFEEIKEDVGTYWANQHAGELARETLDGLREVLAARPEDVDAADWKPVIDSDAFQALAKEAGYTFYEREPLPRGEDPTTMTAGDRFLRTQFTVYDLEEGQVPAAVVAQTKDYAYLIRLASKGDPPVADIDVASFEGWSQRTATDKVRDLGRNAFRGDSDWFVARTKLRFPEKEAREADSE